MNVVRLPRSASPTDDDTVAPPQNLEAERSILGAILLRNETLPQAAEVLGADDFYRDAHRRIFNAMVTLNEQGRRDRSPSR